jgi:hypothetical protein
MRLLLFFLSWYEAVIFSKYPWWFINYFLYEQIKLWFMHRKEHTIWCCLNYALFQFPLFNNCKYTARWVVIWLSYLLRSGLLFAFLKSTQGLKRPVLWKFLYSWIQNFVSWENLLSSQVLQFVFSYLSKNDNIEILYFGRVYISFF